MVGKRGEEHDEKNQVFLLKVLCSRSFCREIQIIYSHLLSFGAEGSLVLHEKRMSLAPLQCFLSGQQTELLCCPQSLHLQPGAGRACQKTLNGMEMYSCSKPGAAFAVSQPCALRAAPPSPPCRAGGAEPFLGAFAPLCPAAAPAEQGIPQLQAFSISTRHRWKSPC